MVSSWQYLREVAAHYRIKLEFEENVVFDKKNGGNKLSERHCFEIYNTICLKHTPERKILCY